MKRWLVLELTTFTFNTSAIRVVDIDGNPWFVAKDALVSMGYAPTAISMILDKLDASEKIVATRSNDYRNLLATLPRVPALSLISESGLYKLVMRSDKLDARKFQDWVTKVVLPAIRKDGAYVMGEEKTPSSQPTRTTHKYRHRYEPFFSRVSLWHDRALCKNCVGQCF